MNQQSSPLQNPRLLHTEIAVMSYITPVRSRHHHKINGNEGQVPYLAIPNTILNKGLGFCNLVLQMFFIFSIWLVKAQRVAHIKLHVIRFLTENTEFIIFIVLNIWIDVLPASTLNSAFFCGVSLILRCWSPLLCIFLSFWFRF